MPTTQAVQVSDLYLHPLNPRQTVDAADIEAKTTSIATLGLLQNLSGFRDPERDGIGIVAGGIRLRALKSLCDQAHPHAPETVEVAITDCPATAASWAAGENTHTPLNAAQEARAAKAMQKEGASVATIADALGRSEALVYRRLKLGDLPTAVLDDLDTGAISTDIAQALTLTLEDTETLQELHAAAINGRINSHGIRSHLQQDRLSASNWRVLFVGLDAYKAAGGTLTQDLFGQNSIIHNAQLVNDLFDAKLKDAATEILKEGWQWCDVFGDKTYPPYELTAKYEFLTPETVDLQEADKTRKRELEEIGDDREWTNKESAEYDALEARCHRWTDDDYARGGLILYVDHAGNLLRHGPFAKPEGLATAAGSDEGDGPPPVKAEKTPAVPAAAAEDLFRTRLHCLQTGAAGKFELMLDLLGYQLATQPWGNDAALDITLQAQNITPDRPGALQANEALAAIGGPTTQRDRMTEAGFAAFCEQGKAHRNKLIAQHLARSLKCNTLFEDVWIKSGADLRKRWTPDAENWFGRVRVDELDKLYTKLSGLAPDSTELKTFLALKKKAKATALERLFADTEAREALGLSREQNAAIDAWVPDMLGLPVPS